MKKLSYWSQLGLGFSEDKSLHLAISLQKIYARPEVDDVRFAALCIIHSNFSLGISSNICRFWGLIYGLHSKYYVAESSAAPVSATSELSADDLSLRETQIELKEKILGGIS